MASDKIIVRGARVHNLKNIDVDIPRDSLTVITGLSGSGKSSLAFDTIYAEGQRRYMESLSAYARQFLDSLERPDVDLIEGLSPAISIEQKTISNNPRSTVGTVTEIYDFIRLLFARVGTQFCYKCGAKVKKQSVDQIIDTIINYPNGTKLSILAPVVKGRKGHYKELFAEFLKNGFTKVRIDGAETKIENNLTVARYKIHNIEIVVDRIVIKEGIQSRINESVELALSIGNGVLIVNDGKEDHLFNQKSSCHVCQISYEDTSPNSFSFNTPAGYCHNCMGLGELSDFNKDLIVPDKSLSINQGAIAPIGKPKDSWTFNQLKMLGEKLNFSFDVPFKNLSKPIQDIIFYGSQNSLSLEMSGLKTNYHFKFDGLLKTLKQMHDNAYSLKNREWVESFMTSTICNECNGGRLRKESLAVKLENIKTKEQTNIHQIVQLSIEKAKNYFDKLVLTERQSVISNQIIKEINQRLTFLLNVGLDYLTLDRSARTLSGGEGQRIRLATQIGTQLVGVMYILDEPSIGLHQRDNIKLIQSLKSLRDLGNTVIVVEHDKEMIESADYVIDVGTGAGERGGEIVATDTPKNLIKNIKYKNPNSKSLTAQYLNGTYSIDIPKIRRKGNGNKIVLEGCTGNNLKNVTLNIPLGKMICVTGVSGSGKSTLINETLFPILSKKIYHSKIIPLEYKSIKGINNIDKVIDIDQSPIGRTPRSNPATYTGVFTIIRDLFAQLPESKIRGYKVGRFSFNVKGGRCDNCEGDGIIKIEMNFLPDVYVKCDICDGRRYNRETLEVHYKGYSISDVLNMTVEEAMHLFSELPRIKRHLQTLCDVGLGYIRLGQQATTLSGGEAQRVKLSTELSKIGTGKTLYILDEPTTGLHFEDIKMMLHVLNKLVDKGNTVIIIEHNLDVIKTADWIIDLGPEGGEHGGYIVAEGTPEDIVKNKNSYTARYLKNEIK